MKKILAILVILPLMGASCLTKSEVNTGVNQPAVSQEQDEDNGVAAEVNGNTNIKVDLGETDDANKDEADNKEAENKDDQNEESVSPKTYQININNFRFSPASLTVKKGDKIVWTNNEAVDHTVNSNNHPSHRLHDSLNLGTIRPGETLTWTADATGVWGYHCHFHPSMTGTIIVE